MEHYISFSDFITYVEEHLLDGWHEDRVMKVQKITKNNGQDYTAMTLHKEGKTISPTIYLEDAYDRYRGGLTFFESLMWIRNNYDAAEQALTGFYLDFHDFDVMRDTIIFRLVHYEKNSHLLEGCPYIKICDLAVTFRCLVDCNEIGLSSTMVTNEMMKTWGVTMDELLFCAQENTERIFPAKICSMTQFLMNDEEFSDLYDLEDMMYIATNEVMINGASVILYDGLLSSFADRIGSGFYILPSSIHEVIFIPEREDYKVEEMLQMVCEANESVVPPEDILAASVYYYNKESRMLECCISAKL